MQSTDDKVIAKIKKAKGVREFKRYNKGFIL